ncbi:MAG: hypothetical protein Q7T20_03000 [Saprospiraceae bacterium]|nr:hypothetical protein [Saprospiraceae bacterium]
MTKFDENQRFWFQCGTLDEEEDSNNNGIIDSIDDTLDLIKSMQEKGIPEKNIRYVEIENGRHEPWTWGEAMPDFLGWVFGYEQPFDSRRIFIINSCCVQEPD